MGITHILSSNASALSGINSLMFEAGSHGLEIKPVFLQLVKGILTFEGTAHKLDENYSLEREVMSYVLKNAFQGLGGLFGGFNPFGNKPQATWGLTQAAARWWMNHPNAKALRDGREASNAEVADFAVHKVAWW